MAEMRNAPVVLYLIFDNIVCQIVLEPRSLKDFGVFLSLEALR